MVRTDLFHSPRCSLDSVIHSWTFHSRKVPLYFLPALIWNCHISDPCKASRPQSCSSLQKRRHFFSPASTHTHIHCRKRWISPPSFSNLWSVLGTGEIRFRIYKTQKIWLSRRNLEMQVTYCGHHWELAYTDRVKGQWRYFVSEEVEIIPRTGALEATKSAFLIAGSDLTFFQWLFALTRYLLNGRSPCFFRSKVKNSHGSTTLLLLTDDVLCLCVIKSRRAHREPPALKLQQNISRAFGSGSTKSGLDTTCNKTMQVKSQSPMLRATFVHFIKTEEKKILVKVLHWVMPI